MFKGYYTNRLTSKGYGVALDLVWALPVPGDYLVVAMEAPVTHRQETLLVMDGQSFPAGKTSVAMTSVATSGLWSVNLWIYFVAADGNRRGQIAISNFRLVEVESASGHLESPSAGDGRVDGRRPGRSGPRSPGVAHPVDPASDVDFP